MPESLLPLREPAPQFQKKRSINIPEVHENHRKSNGVRSTL
jgi:hypothetical protein